MMGNGRRIDLEDVGILILRIMLGGLLLFHGVGKIMHGIDFIKGGLATNHIPAFIAYGVYIGEVLAPVLVIAGLWTRLSALVVAFNLVVAILLARLPALFTLSKSGGWAMELDVFFLLSALALVMLGPGKLRLGRRVGVLS
jgi:putative oxidoreductase